MMQQETAPEIQMIPLDRIDVLNPRDRNQRTFKEIVDNIQAIGLKKPVTVTPRKGDGQDGRYWLICGEGRLKAFQSLGEPSIPALVVEVNDEDAFIMSLSENIARRRYHPLELLENIKRLRDNGYEKQVIAKKIGLSEDWVNDIVFLLEHGEERLLVAVAKSHIPLSAAVLIAKLGNDSQTVRAALQEAYETGKLHRRQLVEAHRIFDRRQSLGRSVKNHQSGHKSQVTASSLVRAYQAEVERQQQMVKKANFAQQRLLFVAGAMKQLLADERFVELLHAEELDALPKYLADQIETGDCNG